MSTILESKESSQVVFSWIFGKRYSGYSGSSKKHPMTRDRLPIYLNKYLFMEIRSLRKKLHDRLKKILKKIFCSLTMNFDAGIPESKRISAI